MELSCHILKCIIELALGGDGGGAFYVMIPDSTGRIVKGIYGIVHIAFSQRRQRLPMVDRAEFIELLAKGTEQSDGGRPQRRDEIHRDPPAGKP